MDYFDIAMKWRVLFAPGASERVGQLAHVFNAKRVMIVTDQGIQKAGIENPLLESLKKERLDISVFNKVDPNPTTKNVEDGLVLAREFRPEIIIALGGGSSIDAAKAINILRTRGGQIVDYRGVVTEGSPLKPLIAVPTTAGTGSEVSPFLLISDSVTHAKIVVRDVQAVPDIAILDPNLTISLPRQATILTGVDAWVHGFESFVAKGSQPHSQALGVEAIQIINRTLPRVVEEPNDLEARSQMLVASNLSGMALAMSYLGLAHSTANPLTRVAGIEHGLAVGMMLPYVIQFNEPVASNKYIRIVNQIFERGGPSEPKEATLNLASSVKRFLVNLGFPEDLKRAGVCEESLPEMAVEALTQATVKSNPREASLEDIMQIYQCAFEGSEII